MKLKLPVVLAALSAGVLAGALTVADASHISNCLGKHPTNTPTAGDDVIVGTPGRDVLAGGAGDDDIRGLAGNDLLCGNEGNDTILGNSGATDRIDGGPGDDDLGGGEFTARRLTGIRCGLASGGAGEPIVVGQPAANGIYGRSGRDSILGAGGVDGLHGGDGNDCIMGLAGDDYLTGGSGADFISAGSGEDTALGEDDYDDLFGQEGNDRLYAGTADIQLPEFPETCDQSGEFAGGAGPVEVGGAAATLVPTNFLVGGDGYDRLVGANRADTLQGDERGDDLYGLGGDDSLTGGRASDCLSGGPGRDSLDDADPNNSQPDDIDTLWGGGSPDTLNALDGDWRDSLDGGSSIADTCKFDYFDVAISC
jgi:Ca2+-binding RTX toxin-like protein